MQSKDESQLIAYKINMFVYILYVCVLCIFIMYLCMYIFQKNILRVYIKYIYLWYKLYEYKYRHVNIFWIKFKLMDRGGGEQSSLACKEICTETSRCEQSGFWRGEKGVVLHDHRDHFKRTLMNHTTLWKLVIWCPFEAQPPYNQTYSKTMLRLNIDFKS